MRPDLTEDRPAGRGVIAAAGPRSRDRAPWIVGGVCQGVVMESQRLRDCLEADFRRLRDVAARADPGARVPSCPEWTMSDLLRHVGAVYLHKVECMRLG